MNRGTAKDSALWAHFVFLLALAASPTAFAQDAPARPQQEAKSAADQGETQTEGKAEKPAKRTLDLSSPRATLRTFLVAIQDAAGDHPERIDDAVKCLDTSELEGEERAKLARSYARRLHAIIDKKGVKLDDISEEGEGTDHLFYQLKTEEGVTPTPEIRFVRDPVTGHWQFSALTLASIPALEEAIVEQAEPPKPSESTVHAARRSPRATMTTFLEAMNADPRDFEEAVLCLDPTGKDREVWSVRGEELATKLKNVMDKIAVVVLAEIPDVPDGASYAWYTSKAGNIVIGRIEEEPADKDEWRFAPQKGEWRFTPKTLDKLDALFQEFERREIVQELQDVGIREQLPLRLRLEKQMPQWLRAEFWHLQGWQWLALAALLPLGWLVQALAAALAALFLRNWLGRWKVDIDPQAQRRVVRSFGAVVAVLFWFYAIQNLGLPEGLLAFLLRATKLALVVTAVWFGYRCVDIVGGHIAANKEVQLTRFDDVLIPLLRKILRLFVVLVVVFFVLTWMGQPPTTVLGALGIGGIALAFAAQDTLGNFFGSITVLFDRPFGIGDWVVIGDVEGMVEHVGFRSTRVRTFYNSVITIPNSRMVNTNVDNYGVRRFRRAKIMLSITYSTPPDKIDAFCEGIRELIRLHPYTRKDYYHVYFNKFAASSLDILLYLFFEAPDWSTELRERHRLFVDILRLANRIGVQFAFPTQTIWLKRSRDDALTEERVSITPGKEDPDTLGLDEAAKVYEDAYGPVPALRGPVVIDATPRSTHKRQDKNG
ncbi:MAG: mechanosensitive ion channel family protein [Phycisphaerae bacterium]